MKNKIMIRIMTALFAALILMGGFSIPAYANGGSEATDDSNVKTEEKFKKARFHRRFSYKTTPPYAPRFTRLRTASKLSPMIRKILL